MFRKYFLPVLFTSVPWKYFLACIFLNFFIETVQKGKHANMQLSKSTEFVYAFDTWTCVCLTCGRFGVFEVFSGYRYSCSNAELRPSWWRCSSNNEGEEKFTAISHWISSIPNKAVQRNGVLLLDKQNVKLLSNKLKDVHAAFINYKPGHAVFLESLADTAGFQRATSQYVSRLTEKFEFFQRVHQWMTSSLSL